MQVAYEFRRLHHRLRDHRSGNFAGADITRKSERRLLEWVRLRMPFAFAFVGELSRIAEHLSQFGACRLEVLYECGRLEERTGDQCGSNLTSPDVARVVNSDDNAPLGELMAAFE